ncbi:MAG: hypothetical protein KatS3mg115_0884 [Candidatus Poribacteria bacterium]|nr:MAG: hypothetical protein KatS3mg115_0884 [Candidatus Poribacteria bacterium]
MRTALFRLFRWGKRLIGGRHGRGLASRPILGALYRNLLQALRPHGIVEVNYHGIPLLIDADDWTHLPLLMGTEYNDPEVALCEAYLRPGDVALDLGANCGCFAVIMARAVGPQGRVFAFEPAPETFQLLRQNLERNGFSHARAVPFAVADRPGTAEFYLSPRASGYHHLHAGEPDAVPVVVTVTSLDAFFKGSPPAVRLLKMDVQGAEPLVLRGAERLLASSPELVLITELEPADLIAFGVRPEEYLTQVEGLGFRLYHISHEKAERRQPIPVDRQEALRRAERYGHINLLAVRREEDLPEIVLRQRRG